MAAPSRRRHGRRQGQFSHPLVVRAKLEIASACHAHGKVPSHCVVTEFSDAPAMQAAARRAGREFGYTRMWSIHPAQIRPILEAFAPHQTGRAMPAEAQGWFQNRPYNDNIKETTS
jgi:citrate lyase beta subunit